MLGANFIRNMNCQYTFNYIPGMKSSALISLLIVLFAFGGCQGRETEVDPAQELFSVKYHLVNTLPSSIRAVNLTVATYFPRIDKTNLWYKHFAPITPLDTISMTVDTTSSTKSFGYVGCTQQMEVNLHYDINDSITYVSTWITKQDTIRIKQDALICFHWPSDTSKAKKTEGYYVNRRLRPYRGG